MNALLKPVEADAHLDPRRLGRLTGSRIGAVLGLNPYSKRSDVLREMVRQHFGAPQEFEGNDATRYGQAMEPVALAKYEAERGVMTYGGGELLIHPQYDFLAVTPDGLVDDFGMIEVKAPFRGNYTHWSEKPYYEAQMHLQMECAGRKWCDFAVLQRDGTLHVSRLPYDTDWLARNLGVLQNFMDEYAATIASPDAAAEHLADKRPAEKAQPLLTLDDMTPVEIFTGPKLDEILLQIRAETASFVPNMATIAGRKEIASLAYKVARSKTMIDDAGKELVGAWKKQAAVVDASRKKARDYLDALRDEVRKPLDDYEAEQARIERERAEAAELAQAAEDARLRAELERREAELKAREDAVNAAEEQARQKAAAEQAARDQAARDEQVRKDAEESATRDAAAAIAKAERDAQEARDAANAAAAKAERDQAEAVRQAEQRAKDQAEGKERTRLAEIAAKEADDKLRAANGAHVFAVNCKAVAALVSGGMDNETAERAVSLIASGDVPNVSIHY